MAPLLSETTSVPVKPCGPRASCASTGRTRAALHPKALLYTAEGLSSEGVIHLSRFGAVTVATGGYPPEIRLTGGAVEVHFALSDLNDLTRWVLGFGSDCEVLEPKELRAAIAEEGRKMAAGNGTG